MALIKIFSRLTPLCVLTQIYELLDPTSLEPRYVGQSWNAKKRYTRHLYDAKRGEIGRVFNWIRSVQREGLSPVLNILEVCAEDDADFSECDWIWQRRQEGCDLTNCTDGGGGTRGYKASDEARAKIGAAHRGKIVSEETRLKVSQTKSGVPLTEDTKAAMSVAQVKRYEDCPVTSEQRQATSERMKGNKHPLGVKRSAETKAKMSLARSGSKAPTASFTEPQVIEIRSLFSAGGVPQAELARRYDVSTIVMHCMLRRKTYKHIP